MREKIAYPGRKLGQFEQKHTMITDDKCNQSHLLQVVGQCQKHLLGLDRFEFAHNLWKIIIDI